jgi:cobalt-zinc-cadmium efflux system outer membrane protein
VRSLVPWLIAGLVIISVRALPRAEADDLTLPDTLSLPALERLVLERNPAIAQSRAEAEESRARARQAGALELPMLDLMVAPLSLGSDAVDPAYRVGLMQPLPLFGQRGLRRRVADAEANIARQREATTRLDLLQQAREAYLEYFRTVFGLETNRALADLMSSFRRVALTRYSAGLVNQQDPLQAEVELGMLDHDRVVLERRRRVAVARLNALLHRPMGSTLPPPSSRLESPMATIAVDSLLMWAQLRRPELAAARARVQARRDQVALVRRSRLPETSFGVAYDRFWMEPELRPTVSLSMSLPIGFGRLAAAEDEACAALAAAEAEQARMEDEVGREVEEAAAGLEETHHELRIVKEALIPASERTLEAVRAAYEGGRSDFLALLNAARDYARARLMLYDTNAMAEERMAALARAVGRERLEESQ